jgi:hypothetical protein
VIVTASVDRDTLAREANPSSSSCGRVIRNVSHRLDASKCRRHSGLSLEVIADYGQLRQLDDQRVETVETLRRLATREELVKL